MAETPIAVVKPKRGRRSKKELEAIALVAQQNVIVENNTIINSIDSNNIELNIVNSEIEAQEKIEEFVSTEIVSISIKEENTVLKATARKRGRKPKGGKIIQNTNLIIAPSETKPNVILHLKCCSNDLQSIGFHESNFSASNIESFNFDTSKNELSYEIVSCSPFDIKDASNDVKDFFTSTHSHECLDDTKDIWKKLKILEQNLHKNNISDKKSACFWCSYDFDNPPIYIPKYFIKDSYHVYGCFCTPECAVAHLMEENIDSSIKFERYHLINHIYSKIYDYKKNIKPAPNPHYTLEKFYGNLTIQEFRSLLNTERLFLIVDKPLTRILPEFHEDNDDFIINNKIIPSNNYQVKKTPAITQKKPQTKNNIMSEKFGFSTTSF